MQYAVIISALLKLVTVVGVTFIFTFTGELLQLPCIFVVGNFFYIYGSFYICCYGKRQGTLKSNSEWRGEWRMARRTANGEQRSKVNSEP